MIRVLFDSFYHAPPGNQIGDNIVVAGYTANVGRYTPKDCFHPNGLMHLVAELANEYEFRNLDAPYTDASLHDADILLAINPDYPMYEGASGKRWTPQAVDSITRFLERGGGMLLLVNSFLSRPAYWEENFDLERVSLLFERLGVRWDQNFMSNADKIEPATDGTRTVGYGAGGRVLGGVLPNGVAPLLTYDGSVYGFMTEVGKGRLVVLGDAGMISNGVLCFPGFQNVDFFRDVFARLTPEWTNNSVNCWTVSRFGLLSCATSRTGLSDDVLQSLRPKVDIVRDHHYRHLTWNEPGVDADSKAIWDYLPLTPEVLRGEKQIVARIPWLSLDGATPPRLVDIKLIVQRNTGDYFTTIMVTGRAPANNLSWGDLCANPQIGHAAGDIESVHLVIRMDIVLDNRNSARSATWSMGQIIYAQNPGALHYNYEILVSAESGAIAPKVQ